MHARLPVDEQGDVNDDGTRVAAFSVRADLGRWDGGCRAQDSMPDRDTPPQRRPPIRAGTVDVAAWQGMSMGWLTPRRSSPAG
jgi:hypothetical protein